MTARVVVVGGGPAGLAVAASMAQHGVGVTLCEAGSWPMPKMCGEFLSPDAAAALASIGAADLLSTIDAPVIEALRATASRGGRVVAESSSRLEFPGHGVSREDLDAALARAAAGAGVELRERCRVTSIDTGSAGARVVTAAGEIAADAIVVATGRVPGIGRDAAQRSRRWVAVKLHVRGLRLPGVTELHFVDGAYVGLNEVACRGERVVNVCVLAKRGAWERAGSTPGGLWAHLAAESPAFEERWRVATPVADSFVAAAGFDFSVRGPRGRGDRPPFYVGDAAALITPLCGDGQAMALAGGVALGEILAKVRDLRDAAAVRRGAVSWEREFRARFRGRIALGRVLQTLLLAPRAAEWTVRAAGASSALTDLVYRATRGGVDDRSSASRRA